MEHKLTKKWISLAREYAGLLETRPWDYSNAEGMSNFIVERLLHTLTPKEQEFICETRGELDYAIDHWMFMLSLALPKVSLWYDPLDSVDKVKRLPKRGYSPSGDKLLDDIEIWAKHAQSKQYLGRHGRQLDGYFRKVLHEDWIAFVRILRP